MVIDARASQPGLRRTLGLWPVTLSGIGIVLGAGIYVLVGEASGDAGGATWIAFLLAGGLAVLTGLSFAELAAMIPEAGGSAAYSEEAFGPHVGFVTGWLDIAVNVIGAAAVALGFAGYCVELFGGEQRAIAMAALAVCTVVVCAGVRETVSLAMVFALLEGAGLAIVIAVGLPDLPGPAPLEAPRGLTGILAATALVFFAYEGFEEMVSLAEETRDPERTIPQAIVIAIGVTSVIYVLVAAVATAVVPWEALAEAPAPLALVASTAAGDRVADVLSVIALFATFNTVLLLLATGARLTYGMSNRRLLPPVFGRLSRRQTPWIAATGLLGLAMVFVLMGDTGYVAQVSTFAVFGQFIAVNSAVIWLRLRDPERDRPFRVQLSVRGVPLLAAGGVAATVLLALFMDRTAFVTGSVALVAGVAVSFFAVHQMRRAS